MACMVKDCQLILTTQDRSTASVIGLAASFPETLKHTYEEAMCFFFPLPFMPSLGVCLDGQAGVTSPRSYMDSSQVAHALLLHCHKCVQVPPFPSF